MVRIVDANIQHAIAFAKLMVKVVGEKSMDLRFEAHPLVTLSRLHPLKTYHGSQQTVLDIGRISIFERVKHFTVDRILVKLVCFILVSNFSILLQQPFGKDLHFVWKLS